MICKAIVTVNEMDNSQANKIARKLRRISEERGVLYRTIRSMLGLSQTQFGKAMGITKMCLVQRERTKRLYSVREIVQLQKMSGMSVAEYWQLLEVIAK
jgi:DNA-binding XRE family transcriptional regulator